MEQPELRTKELELHIENLEFLEFLYRKMKERRSALHSDILEMIECASIEEIFSNLSFEPSISSVSVSLKNEILSEREIEDVWHFLALLIKNLKKSRHEYSRIELLLSRWITFHKEILSE